MPDTESHVSRYKHNLDVLKSPELCKPENRDWAITVAFYAAVHIIESYFAKNDQHCSSHSRRNKMVNCEKNLKKMSVPARYLTLYNQSIRSRYACVPITKKDLDDAINALRFIQQKIIVEQK